jgi:DNA modification methylase
MSNYLYYGDNLDVMRRKLKDETVDLCYIDPPFNSKRNYNQIYNNIGKEDRAQAQAFTDTWVWDERADQGYQELLGNDQGRFRAKTVDLIKGLQPVLGKGSLLAYLVSIASRVTEIHRILKPTGSFYLHCDPTAGHYLKTLLDSIFVGRGGGDFRNEVIWCYKTGGMSKRWFGKKHDNLLFYTKGREYTFNPQREQSFLMHKYGFSNIEIKEAPCPYAHSDGKHHNAFYTSVGMRDVWDIPALRGNQPESLGYPTQKPSQLLHRIIEASSNDGDLVLDAYCGCGTTISVAQRLQRKWIGIDITYQSVSLVLRRLEGEYGKAALDGISLDGIPRDMESARALAHKADDRLRKEFEKWAVLTYTNNRAIINDKKGGDQGIDGTAYFMTGKRDNARIVFQVKSGHVSRGDIAKLNSDRIREGAELACFITLEPETKPMRDEANGIGSYVHAMMGRSYPRLEIIRVEEIVELGKRLDIPMSLEVLRAAQAMAGPDKQVEIFDEDEH